jgi:predicted transcriptional regulator
MTEEDKTSITIRLPRPLRHAANAAAVRRHDTVSRVVRQALQNYVDAADDHYLNNKPP